MKANEFVKKFGRDAAKKILHGMDDASEFTAHMPGDAWDKPTLIDAVALRRLVESHDLVQIYGGLESSKLTVNYLKFFNDEDVKATRCRLSKAIADVESCQ